MNKREQELASFVYKLCDNARQLGASEAVAINAGDIVLDERALIKCMVPMCANYGVNLTCPPNSISFADFKRILGKYHRAILLRVDNTSSPKPEAIEEQGSLSEIWKMGRNNSSQDNPNNCVTDYMQALRQGQERLYSIIEKIESLCLQAGYKFAAGLSAGGCFLCDECVGAQSGLPCRHPFKARPSMEGFGIDVVATAETAGMQLEFNQKTSSWVGLILVD